MIGDSLMNLIELLANQAELTEIRSDAGPLLDRVNHQLESPRYMAGRLSRAGNGSWIKQWYHWSRFVLMQQALVKKVAEKDQLMEGLRRVPNRSVSLCHFRISSSRLL